MSDLHAGLARRLLLRGTILFALLPALLFGAAGTLRWWQGWLFLTVYLGWTVWASAWLLRHDPALLERRMHAGPLAETQPAQRRIMALATAVSIGLVLIPALDRRYGWSAAPDWLAPAGLVLLSLGWLAIMAVFKANSFTAATIEVMPGQTVVTTGPYAIVRHPMYAGTMALLPGIPLGLGSWWGLAPLVLVVPVVIWRLLDEERLLARDLPGYVAYMHSVRYRLIPGLW